MSEYEENGWSPTERMHGYECQKCGYVPTRYELDQGTCPGCRRMPAVTLPASPP
jgi:lipopolysaccharide biosynthesis regulator YciM